MGPLRRSRLPCDVGGRPRPPTLLAVAAVVLAVGGTTIELEGSQGQLKQYEAKPALWNVQLPNFGRPKLSYRTPMDKESVNLQPSFSGRVRLDPWLAPGDRSLGCGVLGPAPRHEAVAVLLERGLCSFRQKAAMAHKAGYRAVVLVNTMPGYATVPDMTAEPEVPDAEVDVPAWALTQEDGQELIAWLGTDHSIAAEAVDSPRWPALGDRQVDVHGTRIVRRI